MGSLVSKLRELYSGKKKLELCVVGLENSGKTTLLHALQSNKAVETLPTVGLSVKKFKKEGIDMKVWDLGGQERFRSEWGRYTQGCDCIIFCLDSADFSRVDLAQRELHKLLEDKALQGLPLLVCLNKIDLEPHLSKEDCIRDLRLGQFTENPWLVMPISALRQTNLGEVVDWLVDKAHD